MNKLIFNSSMPRSGSELLQCILHQNPRIYGSVTSPVLEYMFAARQNYDLPEVKAQNPELMYNAFSSVCEAIPKAYYSQITDRPIVCDKNRGWCHYKEWVEQWQKEPKMICMVRDLRSIIASLERIYRNNRHSPQGIDNPVSLTNMTLDQRVDHWLSTQPVGLALMRTYDCFQRGAHKDILFVKYEDLCAYPEKTMEEIYSYIDEPFFQHNFQNILKEVAEDDSHYGIFGNHSVSPQIRPAKREDWSDVLPKEVAAGIKDRMGWYFGTFGY